MLFTTDIGNTFATGGVGAAIALALVKISEKMPWPTRNGNGNANLAVVLQRQTDILDRMEKQQAHIGEAVQELVLSDRIRRNKAWGKEAGS